MNFQLSGLAGRISRAGKIAIIAAGVAAAVPTSAQAQASGDLGVRVIKSYWIESNVFLAIRPDTSFNNPTGCGNSDIAIIPVTHPAFKQIMAAVVHSMSMNAPVRVWAQGCFSFWGNSFPSFYGIGPYW